jgi:hypothetical protein
MKADAGDAPYCYMYTSPETSIKCKYSLAEVPPPLKKNKTETPIPGLLQQDFGGIPKDTVQV